MTSQGFIAWMTRNPVTPNLLMLFLIIGGLISSLIIRKEVYPDYQFNTVTVSVFYSGSTPSEMESSIILPIENAISDIDGIKEVTSRATSTNAWVKAHLENKVDVNLLMREIENEVNRLSLPKGADKPRVFRNQTRKQSMEVIIYGDVGPIVLREAANRVKDILMQSDYLTQVALHYPPKYQVQVELSNETIQKYGLTIGKVSKTISDQSPTKSGGKLETSGGDVLLQVDEMRHWATEFHDITVVETSNGGQLKLSDVAEISDGFADKKAKSYYNGKPSQSILIYRAGDQTPTGISEHFYEKLPEIESLLQAGIELDVVLDDAVTYEQRMELLLKNAFTGLLLVLIILTLFLEAKVAFWTVIGIPTSFLGAIIFLPIMDISINMISMFAFIIALGIVVDDAIIVGENIYERLSRGESYASAAVEGAKEIAVPLTFSIITNIIAFIPIWFLPNMLGQMFAVVPIVVGLVFAISWAEALFILPSHLAHSKTKEKKDTVFIKIKAKIDHGFDVVINVVYRSIIKALLPYRYLVAISSTCMLVLAISYAVGGNIGFRTMPAVEAEFTNARAVLPIGMSLEDAVRVRKRLEHTAKTVIADNGGGNVAKGISSIMRNIDGEFIVNVRIFLTPSEVRIVPTNEIAKQWRKKTGRVKGVDVLRFSSAGGTPTSDVAGITIELKHSNNDELEAASSKLASILSTYDGIVDIENSFESGTQQLRLRINDKGAHLGLNDNMLLNQVRDSFNGVRSMRQQRGSEEVDVMVTLNQHERSSVYFLEQLPIRVGESYIPLIEIADIYYERAPSTIQRFESQKRITVNADVTPASESVLVTNLIRDEIFPELLSEFPNLKLGFGGDQKEQKESLESLTLNGILLLLALYCLLAIPFNSYTQPILIMVVIPFGFLGALLGHVMLDVTLSVVSLLGVLALSGVVINDSLILIVEINKKIKEGKEAVTAIIEASCRRFRPIVLTTMTTFFGLAPMIWEPSNQAKLMIPMAISLGFGIVFATLITLILLPCLYKMLDDLKILMSEWKEKAPTI